MKRKSSAPEVERRVALCYIRLSQTKNESDLKSPERQRANLLAACERYGWTPEWYEDTDKHKSGTKEDNRPQWMALKRRLNDPDIAVLAVNDTSRAMRNTWRALKLFEDMSSSDVKLYIAWADRLVDIKNPDGRPTLLFQVMVDETYALEGARRAKDSISYRKNKNITVGQPPFGTVRDKKGYLVASLDGAWKLPTGGWQAGRLGDEPPVEGAIWRGYYDAAKKALELYAKDVGGYTRLATSLTNEGWAFRDRWGEPRLFSNDDVRRIIANWRTYAGFVDTGRAKERVAHEHPGQMNTLFDTGRAVFELDLLRKVADVQERRSVTTRPTGSVPRVYQYGLLRLIYCAHCEQIAQQENNPKRRSRLSGSNMGKPRYRHAEGVQCGCHKRTVLAQEIEADFLRLAQALTLKQDNLNLMLELAARTQSDSVDEKDLEQEKRAAIANLKQQLANLLDLYKNAVIPPEDYWRDKEDRERQIAFWENRTTDLKRKALEFERVLVAFSQLVDLWDKADSDERTSLARGLFQYLVYDLDKQQIVDFRLHPWADQYLILRAELYETEGGETGNEVDTGNENRPIADESDGAVHDPNGALGLETVLSPIFQIAKPLMLFILYLDVETAKSSNTQRDEAIRCRYAKGESISDLARAYDITPQRVFQIIQFVPLSSL
ncbi:MAG: recombinase family protein [Chloroflexi bacterium]|nr:recombinase family protein [Chloroflexota bacterium]